MRAHGFASLIVLCAAAPLCACALTSKSEPLVPRYYSPEYRGGGPTGGVLPASTGAAGMQLRLGRIKAGSHLRERIVFRNPSGELGYYEGRRWTERPEDYVRRALSHALFEERGLVRVVSGAAPTLELELVEFEEIRGAQRKARIQAVVVLHDERTVQLEETVSVEQPVRPGQDVSAGPVVDALGEALQAAVAYIADRITERMRAQPPEESGGARQKSVEANAESEAAPAL